MKEIAEVYGNGFLQIAGGIGAVSYTHLTLPTTSRV